MKKKHFFITTFDKYFFNFELINLTNHVQVFTTENAKTAFVFFFCSDVKIKNNLNFVL